MRCEHCGYWWRERGEEHPSCHYEGPDQWAPCEDEDDYYEEPDDCDYEVGLGCLVFKMWKRDGGWNSAAYKGRKGL